MVATLERKMKRAFIASAAALFLTPNVWGCGALVELSQQPLCLGLR